MGADWRFFGKVILLLLLEISINIGRCTHTNMFYLFFLFQNYVTNVTNYDQNSDGQSKKADLDLQPFLIFAKLKGGKTTGINKNEAKEASNLERHSLFGEKDRDTKKGRWFTGVIDLFDPKTDKHHFTYDGDMVRLNNRYWHDENRQDNFFT